MVVMKGYVRNRAQPEGSMIEGYTTEEVVECYTDFIKDDKPIGVLVSRHHVHSLGKEQKEQNQSLMLITKECVRHILASCIS
jgi:hypothetical protein